MTGCRIFECPGRAVQAWVARFRAISNRTRIHHNLKHCHVSRIWYIHPHIAGVVISQMMQHICCTKMTHLTQWVISWLNADLASQKLRIINVVAVGWYVIQLQLALNELNNNKKVINHMMLSIDSLGISLKTNNVLTSMSHKNGFCKTLNRLREREQRTEPASNNLIICSRARKPAQQFRVHTRRHSTCTHAWSTSLRVLLCGITCVRHSWHREPVWPVRTCANARTRPLTRRWMWCARGAGRHRIAEYWPEVRYVNCYYCLSRMTCMKCVVF